MAFGSAQNIRAPCVFMPPRIHEISTGENHEISASNCSNDDADERDNDLVERCRLLWWALLPWSLLHDNDPIIRSFDKGPRRETGGASLFATTAICQGRGPIGAIQFDCKSFRHCSFPFRLSS